MPGSYSLPNPSSPNTSDALTSLPIRQNFQSLQGQVNNADGAALQAKTVPEAALADAINPRLARTEAGTSYVASGLVINPPGSGFIITIPSGVAYVLGVRVVYAGGTITVPASQDTYIDISTTGVITQVAVANNAAAGMTLSANSLRIAKIVSNGTAVISVSQTGLDPLGNQIYNRSSVYRLRQLQVGSFFGFTTTVSSNCAGSPITVILPAPCRAFCRLGGVASSNTAGVGLDWHARLDGGGVLNPVGAIASYFYATSQNIPVNISYDFGILAAGSHTLQIEAASEGAGTFGATLSYDYDFVQV